MDADMTDNINDQTYYITGDWGTSRLRLSLIEASTGHAIASAIGPGIHSIRKVEIPKVINSLTSPWKHYQCNTLMLSGMIGSNIGWADTGYLDCPSKLTSLSESLYQTMIGEFNSWIVPGLRCKNLLGAPDVMRGEEIQLLGSINLEDKFKKDTYLFCLPGTHSKWVHFSQGTVQNFLSCISGELYGLLVKYSVIVNAPVDQEFDLEVFQLGVERGSDHKCVDSMILLFEARSRQLDTSIRPEYSHAFLSGLIIGKDISCTTQFYLKSCDPKSLVFCGEKNLTYLYSKAAKQLGWQSIVMDGEDAAVAGMHQIYLDLIYDGNSNELLY